MKNDIDKLTRLKNDLSGHEPPLEMATLARICSRLGIRAHLAILSQPYLGKIITGEKTIESRFTKSRIAPYNKVESGDVLLLKEKSSSVKAVASVSKVCYFGPLKSGEAAKIMDEYQEQLALESLFKESKRDSAYGTLIYLERVLTVESIPIVKADRRPWVVLSSESNEPKRDVTQLSLFGSQSDCGRGLHCYYNSKQFNQQGFPVCKYCGHDSIDWERVHRRDIADVEHTIWQLKREKCRYDWWNKEIDQAARNHALRKGLHKLQDAVLNRLRRSVGEVHEMPDGTKRPYRDGFQTPYAGNSIYYAQHALACCCRKCMKVWHGVPYGRDLTEQELEYFAKLVMSYVRIRIPEAQEQAIHIPVSRGG